MQLQKRTITAGQRLVVEYDLYAIEGPPPSASALSEPNSKLRNLLSTWKAMSERNSLEAPNLLVFVLSQKLKPEELSFGPLKGESRRIATILRDLTAETGIYACLANLTRTAWGSGEPPEEIDEDEYKLDLVIDFENGEVVANHISVEEDILVQEVPDAFNDEYADETDYEDGMEEGDGGPFTKKWSKTVIPLDTTETSVWLRSSRWWS